MFWDFTEVKKCVRPFDERKTVFSMYVSLRISPIKSLYQLQFMNIFHYQTIFQKLGADRVQCDFVYQFSDRSFWTRIKGNSNNIIFIAHQLSYAIRRFCLPTTNTKQLFRS